MLKKYRLTRLTSLHTSIILEDGSSVFVEFRASYDQNNRLRGTYITTNKELQEAIEKDNAHGVDWELESIDGMIPKEYYAKKEGKKPEGSEELKGKKEEGKVAEDGDIQLFPEITKHQDAKELLLSKFPETQPGDFKSKSLVLAFAAANKISFPNLA